MPRAGRPARAPSRPSTQTREHRRILPSAFGRVPQRIDRPTYIHIGGIAGACMPRGVATGVRAPADRVHERVRSRHAGHRGAPREGPFQVLALCDAFHEGGSDWRWGMGDVATVRPPTAA
jgi:hypothetical protein